MTVAELITILSTMPRHLPVEVNDNLGGQILYIDCVDHFDSDEISVDDGDYPVVMIQVNT